MSTHPEDSSQPIPERGEPDAEGWQRCDRLPKSAAERLLDWLEANGYAQREVFYVDNSGFTVRWRR